MPKASILIVDDVPANLIALEAVLSEYDVVSAKSGQEALDVLKDRNFNVILLDIQMPGMDGFEAARRMKQMSTYHGTPIIFVTANFKDDPYVKKGYEAGGVDYFTKPFDPDILRMKVGIYASFHQKTSLLKEREERIRQSEELLKAGHKLAGVLESLPVGVIISDAKGGILQTNDAVLRIWKSIDPSRKDSAGEFLKWWTTAGTAMKDAFATTLSTGSSSHNEVLDIQCFDGTCKAILVSVSPLLGIDDQMVGAVAVAQDITEHRKIEAHMEESIMKLVSIGVELQQIGPTAPA